MGATAAIDGLVSRTEELLPGTSGVTTAIWVWATRVGRLVEAFTREVLADDRVDNSEFMILVVLLFHGNSATPSQLEPELVLSQSGLARALQRAESNGTIRKIVDPADGRALIIELTDAGRSLVEHTMTTLLDRFDARLGGVDEHTGRRLAESAVVLATALADGSGDVSHER